MNRSNGSVSQDQVGVWNWGRLVFQDEFENLFAKLVAERCDKQAAIAIRMQEIMEEVGGYVSG